MWSSTKEFSNLNKIRFSCGILRREFGLLFAMFPFSQILLKSKAIKSDTKVFSPEKKASRHSLFHVERNSVNPF